MTKVRSFDYVDHELKAEWLRMTENGIQDAALTGLMTSILQSSIKNRKSESLHVDLFAEGGEGFPEEGIVLEGRVAGDEGGRFLVRDLDEADVGEVFHGDVGEAGLARSEERARTAELEVLFGDIEAARVLGEGLEPPVLLASEFSREEEAVGLVFAAADASAELVELGEAEPVGVLDHHDARIRDVDADLDDRGGDEDVMPPFTEVVHDRFLLLGLEAAVEETERAVGEDILREACVLGGRRLHVLERLGFLDEGEDDERLPALRDFRADETVDLVAVRVRRGDLGDDGLAVLRHVGEEGEVETSEVGEGERARDRCRGHGEEVCHQCRLMRT